MIDFVLRYFNKEEENYPGYDTFFYLNMNSVRFVYLQRFINGWYSVLRVWPSGTRLGLGNFFSQSRVCQLLTPIGTLVSLCAGAAPMFWPAFLRTRHGFRRHGYRPRVCAQHASF